MIDRKELAKTNRRIMSFLNPAIKKEPTMKTIYLKAEVLEEANNNILIDINGNKVWCGSESIKQAQVLAVEELVQYLHDEMKKIEIDMRNDSMKIGYGKYENFDLQKLTELVRGKERTLEDVINDLKKAETHEQRVRLIYQVDKILEAEQLLKNRE